MLHGLLSSALGIVALSLLCSCGIGKKSSDQEKAPTITENVREESSERNEEKNDDKKTDDAIFIGCLS